MTPSGLAGEIVLPTIEGQQPTEQFDRTPNVVGSALDEKSTGLCASFIASAETTQRNGRLLRIVRRLDMLGAIGPAVLIGPGLLGLLGGVYVPGSARWLYTGRADVPRTPTTQGDRVKSRRPLIIILGLAALVGMIVWFLGPGPASMTP